MYKREDNSANDEIKAHNLFRKRKLKPGEKQTNVIHTFLSIFYTKARRKRAAFVVGNVKGTTQLNTEIVFGRHIKNPHFNVQPFALRIRELHGPEISHDIAQIYNANYYLIGLWEALVGSSNTKKSRSITRAFIINCIAKTAEFYAKEINFQSCLDSNIVAKYQMHIIDYYKNVLSWDGIFAYMRQKDKIKLKKDRNFSRNISKAKSFKSADYQNIINVFKESNIQDMEEYKKFIEFVGTLNPAGAQGIIPPLLSMLIPLSSRSFNGGKIKREISTLLHKIEK